MSAAARLTIPDLAGKAVLITGASTGIGAAVAKAFGAQGSKVVVHYNSSKAAAEAVAGEIRDAGGTAHLVHGDVSAGLMLGRVPFGEITDERYDAVLDLNARSVVVAVRTALPHLKKNGGFIINTTSVAARNGGGGGAVLYAAAKGFVSTVTRGIAKEFIGSGIRVNGVAPGLIQTPFHDRYTPEDVMRTQAATIPLGRAGTPEECVGAYLFLASEMLSGYIVGQIIEVNGGQLMP
jgi:3-oxoacyl-[acyl-carrier protein] reductase